MPILLTFQKYIREILLLLILLLGLALGQLTATLIGLQLNDPAQVTAPAAPARDVSLATPPLASFKPILERNIFNAQVGNLADFGGAPAAQRATPSSSQASAANLTLLGTIAGGPKALALIEANREIATYLLGASLPGGSKLVEVQRNKVVIEMPDGRRQTLEVDLGPSASATSAATDNSARNSRRTRAKAAPAIATTASGIHEIGENRWLIPAEEADKARSNINELLRQARVEPNIVNGQTDGFVVSMIRPGSLFSMLGIQVGDVLRDVNGVKLDTPEKALQIFQQLREARQISISLERSGQPQTFSYEIN